MSDVYDAMRVYVLWAGEGDDEPGLRLARALAERLDAVGMTRDGIGFRIPVRLRNVLWSRLDGKRAFRRIDFDAAACNVIIVVYDDIMAARDEWLRYLEEILPLTSKGGADVKICVQASPDASPRTGWGALQMIRAVAPLPQAAEVDWQRWLRRVAMDVLATTLSHRRAIGGERLQKMKFFLSHAKTDGVRAAMWLKRFCALKPEENITSLDLFFDASDTISGSPFGGQFREAIRDCGGFLAILTDTYHTRRWCQWEMLLAKELQRPIVVWDLSEKGVLRSFPYLGNVPVVRGANAGEGPELDREVEELLLALLSEALRMTVWSDHAKGVVQRGGNASLASANFFARPPELTDIAHRSAMLKIIIYPDPPLSHDERALLNAAYPAVKLLALSEAAPS